MPLLILSLAIQVLLIVHAIRTKRNSLWIWALALLPLAGPIAYLIVEVLPELARSWRRHTIEGCSAIGSISHAGRCE
ncbi:MAG TPA: hypothetical protein VIH25_06725 [Steroidobacteraceae bacterium]